MESEHTSVENAFRCCCCISTLTSDNWSAKFAKIASESGSFAPVSFLIWFSIGMVTIPCNAALLHWYASLNSVVFYESVGICCSSCTAMLLPCNVIIGVNVCQYLYP